MNSRPLSRTFTQCLALGLVTSLSWIGHAEQPPGTQTPPSSSPSLPAAGATQTPLPPADATPVQPPTTTVPASSAKEEPAPTAAANTPADGAAEGTADAATSAAVEDAGGAARPTEASAGNETATEAPAVSDATAPTTPNVAGETDATTADPYPFPEGEAHRTGTHHLDNDASGFKLGKGLVVSSQDGDFSLETRLRAQFLYTIEKSEVSDGEWESATEGLQIRRARLQFAGNFWGKHNRFKAELAVSPADMGVRDSSNGTAPGTSLLLDWYLDLTHLRDLSVRLGQYKVPFNRQRVISSGDLQLVDRSIVNSRFNVDRDIGFDIRSKDLFGLDKLKYYLGVYTGEGRNSNNQSDFGMMYLARVEVLPMGGFKDYAEADFERLASPKMSIGLGYGYLDRAKRDRGILGSTPADGGTTDFNLLNGDIMFKFAGLSVFSEAIWRQGSRETGDSVDDTGAPIPVAPPLDGYGAMIQAGYLIPKTRFEVAARAGMVRPTGDDSALEEEDEIGGGLNFYFAHHAYKLQTDYFYSSAGPDADNRLGAHEMRIQLQAAF